METPEMEDPMSGTSSSSRSVEENSAMEDPIYGTLSSLSSEEEDSANEFLSLLKKAMPSDGVRGARQLLTAPTGELMGRTENESATYLTSGSACLDSFSQVVPTTPGEAVVKLLEKAWKEDNLTALKQMFHLRGVRGTEKSDKERFYDAALWMYERNPSTLLFNLAMVAEFGYFKDIPDVILRIVEGPEIQSESAKVEAKERRNEVVERGKASLARWRFAKKLRSEEKQENTNGSKEAENPEVSDSNDSNAFRATSLPLMQS